MSRDKIADTANDDHGNKDERPQSMHKETIEKSTTTNARKPRHMSHQICLKSIEKLHGLEVVLRETQAIYNGDKRCRLEKDDHPAHVV